METGVSAVNSPHVVLALDVGGTWTRAAVIARDSTIVRRHRAATPSDLPGTELARFFAYALTEVGAGFTPAVVGISITGPVDPCDGVLYDPPNTGSGLAGLPIAALVSAALGRPVVVDRDTNAALRAEHALGAGRGCTELVYLTFSTGVGGSVLLGGQLLRGADGVAGEIGHVVVDLRGPRCGCGRRGCLEAVASGPAIARAGVAARAEEVAAAARAGEPAARAVIERAGEAAVSVIVDQVNVFNPQRVVVGGAVADAHPEWIAAAQEAVAMHALVPANRRARVVAAALGDDGGLLGAGLIALAHAPA